MSTGQVVAWVLLTNCVAAMFAFYVAAEKNRSAGWWTIMTLVFGLVALVALAGIPPVSDEEFRRGQGESEESRGASAVGSSGRAWNPLTGPPPDSEE